MRHLLLSAALSAGLALSLAGTASAAVSGVTSLHIINAQPNYIQIGEVVATQSGTGTDVALSSLGATASAFSVYEGGPAVAANAIDGVFDTTYPHIYHSNGSGSNEYLDITFSAPVSLDSVTIYGRSDCCSDRDQFDLFALGSSGQTLATAHFDNSNAAGGGVTEALNGAVSAAPEPGAWALMFAGVGVAGLALRRRKEEGGATFAA